MTYLSLYPSPLGEMTMASDGSALTGLWFSGQKYDLAGVGRERILLERWHGEKDGAERRETQRLEVFAETGRWLDLYFSGGKPDFTPEIKLSGSEFRKLVAEIMLMIPYGTTTTYGEIAKEVERRSGGKRMSAQAVGGAVGHNAISIIVPCHRVVGSDGNLIGYAGGIERKRKLLQMEGIDLSRCGLFVPVKK